MTRRLPIKLGVLALGLALLTASPALAQSSLERAAAPTGLMATTDEPASGFQPQGAGALAEYAKMLRAVEMAVSFETRRTGGTHTVGPVELDAGTRIDANVRFDRRGGDTVLESLDLRPVGGEMKIGGKRVNSVTFNNRGELTLDISWYPKVTITNIERKRNGDIRLHLKGLPDVTIKKNGEIKFLFFNLGTLDGDFEVPSWPPKLEELVKLADSDSEGPAPDLASLTSRVSWRARAVADADSLRGRLGAVPSGTYTVDVAGEARNVNGRLKALGENNSVNVRVDFDRGRNDLGPVTTEVNEAEGVINGRYRFTMPLDGSSDEQLNFEFDGRAEVEVDGRNVNVHLPGDASIYASSVTASGSVDVDYRYGDGRSTFSVDNGNYSANLRGPLRFEGVALGGVELSPVNLDGSIDVNGRLDLRERLLVHRGNAVGRAHISTGGVTAALRGEDANTRGEFEILEGSSLDFNIDRFTTFTDMDRVGRPGSPYLEGSNASGRVKVDLELGRGRLSTDGMEVELGEGRSRAGFETDVNARLRGSDVDIRRGEGRLEGELGADATVRVRGSRTSTTPAARTGLVSASSLNVRTGPGTDNAIAATLSRGAPVEILDSATVDGKVWHRVRGTDSDGRPVEGHVSGRYITESPRTGTITAELLNVRKGPGTDHEVVGRLPKDTKIQLLASRAVGGKTWHQVRGADRDGRMVEGFVSGTYVNEDPRPVSRTEETPYDLSTTIRAGSSFAVNLDSFQNEGSAMAALADAIARGQGGARAELNLGRTELAWGALRTSLDNAEVAFSGGERATEGQDGPVRMTFRVALRQGSKILINKPGVDTDVEIAGDDSHLSFEALAVIGPDGKPAIKTLTNVDLKLELGETAARVMGNAIDMPGTKTVTLTGGRVEFLSNGVDVFGTLSVTVASNGDTPALRIRW